MTDSRRFIIVIFMLSTGSRVLVETSPGVLAPATVVAPLPDGWLRLAIDFETVVHDWAPDRVVNPAAAIDVDNAHRFVPSTKPGCEHTCAECGNLAGDEEHTGGEGIAPVCCDSSTHDALKRSPQWASLVFDIQHLEASGDEPEEHYEVANCEACHSTLYKLIEESREYEADSNATLGLTQAVMA